jgi:hypothetical protein
VFPLFRSTTTCRSGKCTPRADTDAAHESDDFCWSGVRTGNICRVMSLPRGRGGRYRGQHRAAASAGEYDAFSLAGKLAALDIVSLLP